MYLGTAIWLLRAWQGAHHVLSISLPACRYDAEEKAFVCDLPNSDRPQFHLHPAVVRRNDTSAKSINEWTREKTLRCCSSFLPPCDPQLAMWNLYF